MFRHLFLWFALLFGASVFAQVPPEFGEVGSHEFYVDQLSKSKDVEFQELLAAYDAYILMHPTDINAQVERCKFIGNSYIDEYEEYNLKYEETEACLSSLVESHPEHPQVLIYTAENKYGDERFEILETARKTMKANEDQWGDSDRAIVFRMLADYLDEEQAQSLYYYKKAQELDDGLDLSLQIARIYEEQGKKERATEVLLPNLHKDTLLWNINQKGNLLLKLGEPEKALELFEQVREKDSTYIDNHEMALAMAGLKNYGAARLFLVRDTLNEWNRTKTKQRLLQHDLEHSETALALEVYRSLQADSPFDDLFGIKRFRIFLKDPFLAWTLKETFHFTLLYLLVIVALIMPYLWILPVQGIGRMLKNSGYAPRSKLQFHWTIEHFWVLSFVYMMAQLVTVFVYEYELTMNYYFDLVSMYGEEEIDGALLADEMVLFVLFMAFGTVLVMNKKRWKQVFASNLRIRQMIGLGVLFVIFNRIIIRLLGLFVEIEEPAFDFNVILGAEQDTIAVMQEHGFFVAVLLVAVVVPIYEEIIFRGAILGSVEKYIGFKGANVFQAMLFALVHDDMALFPFFFIFALVVGYWVKRSGGLLTGIFFHAIHNFTVVLALYYLSKMANTIQLG